MCWCDRTQDGGGGILPMTRLTLAWEKERMWRPLLSTSRSKCRTGEHITPVLAFATALAFPGMKKKDGFVYACCIWAAALVFVHTFSLCIVNLWVCFPLPQVWFCSSAGFQDCLDQRILIMNTVALLPVWWIAAVYIIPPLHTWWGNFPPRLIVAIKHTSVKYPHYCISVYVYILIWVDSSVWGAHQQLPSRWKLSPLSSSLRHFLHLFPFAFTPPLPHSRFRMLSSRVACFCTRSYETLAFVVSVRVSVTRCEHVCFTFGGKKSQVVMHVWDCGWLRLTWT